MKNTLLPLLLLMALSTNAQIYGKKILGPVEVSGYRLKIGDTLHFGRGTLPDGWFKYITQPPNIWAGSAEMHLHRSFSGRFLIVKDFKEVKSKDRGGELLAVINPGGFNYAVELEDAIAVGEISAINSIKVKQPTTSQPVTSVADELLKLKQLLEAGAITQDEFNAQKKKLLNQ